MNVLEIIKKISGKTPLISGRVEEWKSWYAGKVKRFHRYTIYNGRKRVPMERMTLGMPKKICEDWANLLMNEKTDIVLADDKSQDVLNKYLEQNNFWKKANGAVEKYMALGQGAIVEGIKNLQYDDEGNAITNGMPTIQLINGEKIYPLTFENDTLTESAFVNENPGSVLISIHIKDENGEYVIHNIQCLRNANDKLNNNLIYDEEKDHTIFYTHSTTPWFQYLKPNIENNIDINMPTGISVYANSIDVLKSLDMTYDSMYNELNLGRKRIFISTRTINTDAETGDTMPAFDQNDVEYYVIPESYDGKTLITNDTQQLRVDAIDKALQRQLNLLSTKCGFGQNHYKFESGSITTATQVVSENSDEFRTLKKHEIVLEEALIGMTKALIYIINNYTTDTISVNEDEGIQIKFDDSIIEDKESEKTSDRLDLEKGIISRAEYRAKYYNEDIKEAEKKIKEISLQNNNQIISDIVSIRNDISQETALELNPYIDDVKAELKRIEEERANSISLINFDAFTPPNNEENDSGNINTQPNQNNANNTQNNANNEQ